MDFSFGGFDYDYEFVGSSETPSGTESPLSTSARSPLLGRRPQGDEMRAAGSWERGRGAGAATPPPDASGSHVKNQHNTFRQYYGGTGTLVAGDVGYQFQYPSSRTPSPLLSGPPGSNFPSSQSSSSSSSSSSGGGSGANPPFTSTMSAYPRMPDFDSSPAPRVDQSIEDDSPLLTPPRPLWLYLGRAASVFGREVWEFAVPLILVRLFPSNIMAAAMYSLTSIMVVMIVSPMLSHWFGQMLQRSSTLIILSLLQLAGSVGSGLLMYWLVLLHPQGLQFWQSSQVCLILVGTSLLGAVTPLHARLLDEVVDSEWTTLLFSRSERVEVTRRLGFFIGTVRIVAPLLTGFLLGEAIGFHTGLIAVIAISIFCALPTFVFLWQVVAEARGYSLRNQVFWRRRFPNPINFLLAEWSVYSNQAVFLVVLTNLLVWISIFNPHSSILTAILKCYDSSDQLYLLSNPVLGGVRALSALFGSLIGPFFFSMSMQRLGLIPSTQLFVIFAAIMALLSSVFFQIANHNYYVFTILFLGSNILVEFFSCGFSTGEDQILQAGVPRQWRNTLHVAQVAFTDIALFIVYGGATILSYPSMFPYMIWATFVTTAIAAAVFGLWSLNRTNRNIVLLGPMLVDSMPQNNDSLMGEDEIN